MPFPMTPTQFTVLTIASASASRRLPRCNSTIILVVPTTANADHWPMCSRPKCSFYARRHPIVADADLMDEIPRARFMDEKFGLAAPAAIGLVWRVRPILGLHDRPVHLVQTIEIVVELGEVHGGVTIGEREAQSAGLDRLCRRDEMHDRLLAL